MPASHCSSTARKSCFGRTPAHSDFRVTSPASFQSSQRVSPSLWKIEKNEHIIDQDGAKISQRDNLEQSFTKQSMARWVVYKLDVDRNNFCHCAGLEKVTNLQNQKDLAKYFRILTIFVAHIHDSFYHADADAVFLGSIVVA